MNKEQILKVQSVALDILESIDECGENGAPAGPIYAALIGAGCSFNQYNGIMKPMEERGFLVDSGGYCYKITESGKEFMRKLQVKFGKGK